jgi:hypothetical protein
MGVKSFSSGPPPTGRQGSEMFGGGPSGSRISVTSKSIRAAFERINPAFLNTPALRARQRGAKSTVERK